MIDGATYELEHPVAEAIQLGDSVVVLFDHMSQEEYRRQFPNMIAVSRQEIRLWTAELPTAESADGYWKIASVDPLIACSFISFECELDQTSGRIRKRTFYK